jgi:hypothetical protein
VSRLAAAFRRAELDAEQAARVRKAVEAGEEPPPNPRAPAGDRRHLRGVPVHVRGVTSTMAGTDPARRAAEAGEPAAPFLTDAELSAWVATLDRDDSRLLHFAPILRARSSASAPHSSQRIRAEGNGWHESKL